MAEMVCAAFVQETVSRGVSFVLGKREEKPSQGHLMERLQMAVSQLEFALERAEELPITHLPLLKRREMFKCARLQAMKLVDKHKQQQEVPPGQKLQVTQAVKRKRWSFWAKDMSSIPSATLSTADVRRFEWFADSAHKFVRDVESGCSLYHNNFCNSIVRHLLDGKFLRYSHLEQGNLLRQCFLWPVSSDDRGVEAGLLYSYEDSRMAKKCFQLYLFLRLSDSTDIVRIAIKGLQLLTSGFKLAAECAIGELTLLSNLHDIAHSSLPPSVGLQDSHIRIAQSARPDPACCKASRHGHCAEVSSGLADILPEQVISLVFQCYIPAQKSSTRSSFEEVSRGWKPPLQVTVEFRPHFESILYRFLLLVAPLKAICENRTFRKEKYVYAVETIGHDAEKFIDDVSIEEVAETIKSNAMNCFSRQPELREYRIEWTSGHGGAWFVVKNASVETAGVSRTRKRYNTRSSKSKGKEVAGGY